MYCIIVDLRAYNLIGVKAFDKAPQASGDFFKVKNKGSVSSIRTTKFIEKCFLQHRPNLINLQRNLIIHTDRGSEFGNKFNFVQKYQDIILQSMTETSDYTGNVVSEAWNHIFKNCFKNFTQIPIKVQKLEHPQRQIDKRVFEINEHYKKKLGCTKTF